MGTKKKGKGKGKKGKSKKGSAASKCCEYHSEEIKDISQKMEELIKQGILQNIEDSDGLPLPDSWVSPLNSDHQCVNFVRLCSLSFSDFCLIGPDGAGKTHLTLDLAQQMGARWMDLTHHASDLKLMHYAFEVASLIDPCFIFIDRIHNLSANDWKSLINHGSKRVKSGMGSSESSSKSSSPSIDDMDSVEPSPRAQSKPNGAQVMVIGHSSQTFQPNPNMISFFGARNIFKVPIPDFSARFHLWNSLVHRKIQHTKVPRLSTEELTLLASHSEGYTGGCIIETVNSALTKREIQRKVANRKKLDIRDLFKSLTQLKQVYAEERAALAALKFE